MPYNFDHPSSGSSNYFSGLASGEKIQKKEEDVEKKIIFGTDISKNNPPEVEKGILRFYDKSGKSFSLSDDLMSKHLLLLGGIGCGKTTIFNQIIEQISRKITDQDVMIIFDTKGDFYRKFYNRKDSRHLLIGNAEQYVKETCYWNIYKELLMPDGTYNKAICDVAAKEIAKQLFKGRESSSQPFFSDAAADLLSKVLIFFMRHGKTNLLNNEVLVGWLKNATAESYIALTSKKGFPDFHSARSYIGQGNTPQALGVLGYINSMVDDLFVGVFSKKAEEERKELSMRRLVREAGGKILFVEYDLSVGEVLGPIYKILFDLALKEALGRRETSDGCKRNVYLIIDEFKLLPELLHIDDGLNFGRSLGVKIFAGLQSVSQLSQVYGEERAKVIAAGFMNQFCFYTWDKESRDFIRQRFGDTYMDYMFYDSKGEPVHRQREGHVVEDWDILGLKTGDAYISLIGYDPFFFQFRE